MMIDHDVGGFDFLAEVGRLHIEHRDLVELAERLGRRGLNFDFEQMHHGAVLGPRHRSEG